MNEYVYVFGPGDRPELRTEPDAWTDADRETGAAHYERLRLATEAGTVILAGLALDGVGPAIVVFEAEDDAAAMQFMEDDPFVVDGLFTATLHPFRASLVREATAFGDPSPSS